MHIDNLNKNNPETGFPIYDLHLHTRMSDGRMPIEFLLETAERKGYRIGISDHLSAKSTANKGINSDAAVEKYLDTLAEYPVLKGGELDLGAPLPFSKTLLARFDYLIGSMHYVTLPGKGDVSLWDHETPLGDHQEYMERYVAQFEKGLATLPLNVVGHPTVISLDLREEREKLWTPHRRARMIAAAKKHNVAFEISTRYEVPDDIFIREALAAECFFTVASDGHHAAQICQIDYSLQKVKDLAIPATQIWWPGKFSGRRPVEKQALLDNENGAIYRRD